METYEPKARVINCKRCQKFGHIVRLCRSMKPKCGNFCSEDHETKDCAVEERNFKCAHCGGNHNTGNRKCEVWKSKEEELTRNYNHG